MDKKTIIGLLLVGVILFGYTFYSSKQADKVREAQELQLREQFTIDSLDRVMYPEKYNIDNDEALATAAALEQRRAEAAETAEAQRVASIGESLAEAGKAESEIFTLENDVLRLYISTRGAQVENVWLKDFRRYHRTGDGDPLKLYKEGTAKFDMEFFIQRNYNFAQVNTADYVFTDVERMQIPHEDGRMGEGLKLRLPVEPETGAYIEYVYVVYPDDYMVDFDIRFVGMNEMTSRLTDFRFYWDATTLQNEKGFKNENMYTNIAYRFPGAGGIEQLGASEGDKSKKVPTKVEWLSFKQQFFSSIFIAENNFSDAEFGYRTHAPGSGKIKDFTASMTVPFTPSQDNYDFKFYYGPNKFSILKSYDRKLEKVIPLGGKMISWINTGFVIPVFNWLSGHIASFGIIILLLTLMIKTIILPLTYKSYMSSAKMKALKPELDQINERYPKQEDAMKKQQATMSLYKQAGVSPLGGCLPMLIQMPILFAMFRFFPASIELRGQRFLWAEDLSAYDSIVNLGFNIPMYGDHISLFTLLMAASLFFYSKLNYEQTAMAGGQQMAGMKFMTVYLMPIMMLLWFNSYASGLTYYYMLSQLLTIGVMAGIRGFVNEDKLRLQIAENMKKSASGAPKKKSKFQQRYEEALRQSQQQQRQQAPKSAVSNTTAGGRAKTAKPQSTKNQPPKKKRK